MFTRSTLVVTSLVTILLSGACAMPTLWTAIRDTGTITCGQIGPMFEPTALLDPSQVIDAR